jgi:predicted GNAT superfamily acetyltransferase
MSELEVRVPGEDEDMQEFSDVMMEAWDGMPESEVIPSHVFEASRETGNVLGAYMDGELVGLAYQIPDMEEEGVIHSHAVGVASEHAGEGIGEQIKRGQRQHAVEKGFDTVEWTYDPLLGMNANLNIGKLGGKVSEYREDVYDSDNETTAGETPADRFVVEWDLESDHVQQTLEGEDRNYEPETVLSAEGPQLDLENSVVQYLDGEYELGDVPEGTVAVQIPRDRSKAEEAGTEQEWRYATREAFQTLFDEGFEVVGFRTPGEDYDSNTYILER